MVEYKQLKRNLINTNSQFVDTSKLSTNFFNITSIPEYFSAGKNSFNIKPNFNNLSQNYPIYIEVLDSNGNNTFHNVTTAEEADGTKIIAVYVYRTTSLGTGTITFIGTSNTDLNGNKINPEQVKQNNIKFVYNIGLDKFKINDNDIIFENNPKISVTEKKYSVIEDRFVGSSKEITKTGTVRYSIENGKPKLFSLGETFSENYTNATISFPYLSNNTNPPVLYETASLNYSASIISVDSNYTIELDERLLVTGINGELTEIISAEVQPYFLRYNQSSNGKNITQNIKNYARIDVNDIDPTIGSVSRVKIFGKSKNDPGADYKEIYDGKIEAKNILIDSNSQIVDYPIGKFTSNVNATIAGISSSISLNALNYWEPLSFNGAPSAILVYYNTNTFSGITTKYTGELNDNQTILIAQSSSVATQYYKDTLYELQFDAYRYISERGKEVTTFDVYAIGDAFISNSEFGKFIGSVPLKNFDNQFSLNNKLSIFPDKDGTGQIRFSSDAGIVLQNIEIKETVEFGFTPKRTTLYVPGGIL